MSSARVHKFALEKYGARIHLFGCDIDNLTVSEAVDRVESFIQQGGSHCYFALNVHKVVAFRSSPELCQIANRSELVTADGQPIVWVSKWLGKPIKQRLTGADLMGHLIQMAAEKQYRVYLLGGRPEVLQCAVNSYHVRFPRLQIAGYRHGYWADDEENDIVAAIRDARPDMLFLGMSSPHKELFMDRRLNELQVPFTMGVGGTLDIIAGVTRRAPVWIQRIGFEWLWRVMQEPRRMFKRYLFDGIRFFYIVIEEVFIKRSRSSPESR